FQVEIRYAQLLQMDAGGGIHLNLNLKKFPGQTSPRAAGSPDEAKWTIQFLELEVAGRTQP
ncbi:MAG: hypothetical protein ACKO23_13325, partial [Gemmataceae bacterium]